MKLYGALVLFLMVSSVCGLKCYSCVGFNSEDCTKTETCPDGVKQCFSQDLSGLITKGCASICGHPVRCCEGNLCNNAIPTGSSVLLLLVSSSIITIFL